MNNFSDKFFNALADYVWTGDWRDDAWEDYKDRRADYLSGGPLDNTVVDRPSSSWRTE